MVFRTIKIHHHLKAYHSGLSNPLTIPTSSPIYLRVCLSSGTQVFLSSMSSRMHSQFPPLPYPPKLAAPCHSGLHVQHVLVVQAVQCHVLPSFFILSVGVLLHVIGNVDAQDGNCIPHQWCLIKRYLVLDPWFCDSPVQGLTWQDPPVELLPDWEPTSFSLL